MSEITMGLGLRPCGACRAYVPATGCGHWKPTLAKRPAGAVSRAAASARARARQQKELDDAREQMHRWQHQRSK